MTPSLQSIDEQFTVLADVHRRAILRYLGHHGTVSFDAVRSALAASPSEEPTVGLELRHVHLPMLEDTGFITYDPIEQTIEPTGTIDARLRPVLESDARSGEYGVQI